MKTGKYWLSYFDHKTGWNGLAVFPPLPCTQDVNGWGRVFSRYMQVMPSFIVLGEKSSAVSGIVPLLMVQTWFMCLIQSCSLQILNAGRLRYSPGLCKPEEALSIEYCFLFFVSIQKQSTGTSYSVLEVWKQGRKEGCKRKNVMILEKHVV